MKRDRPDLFERAADLEALINERRDMLGKDDVWFTRFGRPLREAFAGADPLPLFDPADLDASCDSGHCFR